MLAEAQMPACYDVQDGKVCKRDLGNFCGFDDVQPPQNQRF